MKYEHIKGNNPIPGPTIKTFIKGVGHHPGMESVDEIYIIYKGYITDNRLEDAYKLSINLKDKLDTPYKKVAELMHYWTCKVNKDAADAAKILFWKVEGQINMLEKNNRLVDTDLLDKMDRAAKVFSANKILYNKYSGKLYKNLPNKIKKEYEIIF